MHSAYMHINYIVTASSLNSHRLSLQVCIIDSTGHRHKNVHTLQTPLHLYSFIPVNQLFIPNIPNKKDMYTNRNLNT